MFYRMPKFLAVLIVALGLTGCMHGAAGNTELIDRLTTLASDPNCGHRDTINIILGPVPSGSILLDRNCPVPQVVPLRDLGLPPTP